MIPRSFSFKSLSKDGMGKTIKNTKDTTKMLLVEASRMLSKTMSQSKGRNKICGIIQYAAKFRYYCNIHSNIPNIKKAMSVVTDKKTALMSGRIVHSMSKGRKIFRFLKFVDEFYKISELMKKSNKFNRILTNMMLMSRFGSFFYYILDNFLWAINTGIFSKFPPFLTNSNLFR